MSGWDSGVVTSANLTLLREQYDPSTGKPLERARPGEIRSAVDAQNQFRQFLMQHTSEDQSAAPYREEIKANFNEGTFFVSPSAQHD